jgi:glucose/arabinose dehydrogenase
MQTMTKRKPAAQTMSLELVAEGFSFPTSLTVGDGGALYVAEAGLPWGGAPPGGCIWKLDRGGQRTLLAEGLRPPVNGLTWHEDSLFVSEGGSPGRISRIFPDGGRQTVLDNLPGAGNYIYGQTNMAVFGPDGKLYFSQGAMTNGGIVGLDADELGWLRRHPDAHDLPGFDLRLAGVNVETANPLRSGSGEKVRTGAFVPFGTPTEPGQRVPAQLPCTAGIMRCNPDGSGLERVAWGLQNTYGLGFLPDGRLLALDLGAGDRGSRPVGGVTDLLFEIREGAWYGWPDFIGGDPVTDPKYRPARGPAPTFLLANHRELPPPERPLFRFPAHPAATKFDVAPAELPEWGGQLFIALFGDERTMTAPAGPPVGRAVVRLDLVDGSLHLFLADPLSRPIDVRFDPADGALYLLDFGAFEVQPGQDVVARAGSGRVWRAQWARQAA